ncbi:MAG: hypothetical protein ACI9OI_002045, partial [Chitinophagales bacterium]
LKKRSGLFAVARHNKYSEYFHSEPRISLNEFLAGASGEANTIAHRDS